MVKDDKEEEEEAKADGDEERPMALA